MTDSSTPPEPTSRQDAPIQYRNTNSGRHIMPGWMNLEHGVPDRIEVQLDLKLQPGTHEHALIHIEYRDEHRQLILQGLLPVRAFTDHPEGWCVMLPGQGSLLIRAIDPTPDPPVLVSQVIELHRDLPAGTVIQVETEFDQQEEFVYQTPE